MKTGIEFVALDVETANRSRASICAFGLSVVIDGQITETHSWLSKPPADEDYFDPLFTAIHGIAEEDCADAPNFEDSLARALSIIDGRPVVAHNAAFDVGAIREACLAEWLDWPTLDYACSLVMSRRSLDLVSYRLPLVCEDLGIEFTGHHNAGADAAACAQVVLALADRAGAESLDDLLESLMIRLGRLTAFDWSGCVTTSRAWASSEAPPAANADADPDHPLYGHEIAFTGGLSVVRREAWEMVAAVGGVPASGVTKRTRYLVIGDGFMGESPEEFHTGKAAKASKYRAKGIEIEALTEGDLWSMLADSRSSGSRADAVPA